METSRERSGEEDDLLARSTKKIKAVTVEIEDTVVITEEAIMGEAEAGLDQAETDPEKMAEEPAVDGTGQQPGNMEAEKQSFRDKVRGRAKTYDQKDLFGPLNENDGLIQISTKDSWPSIRTSPQLKAYLNNRCRNCLIVKLLGRNIGYKVLYDKIMKLWNLMGDLELIEIGEGYFVVKFYLEEDIRFALEEGPWVIFGHYLTVRRWRPNFRPSDDTIMSTAVWIRFPELSVEERVLLALWNTIGRAIKVDNNTHFASRGKFARVCVEIDNKPLVPKV